MSSDGIITGTTGDDVIDSAFIDADGDFILATGQTIQAGDGDDYIYDGAGDDTVEGGSGRDRFYAGEGADHYDGGLGSQDEVSYTQSTAGLTINMVDASASSGMALGDTFTGVERLRGTESDDTIIVNADITHIYGRGGNDSITDAAGAQYLSGGSGADTFRFGAGDGAQDWITDFENDLDQIDVSAWGVTDFSQLTITGRANQTQGVIVDYGAESIRINNLLVTQTDLLDAGDFIFL